MHFIPHRYLTLSKLRPKVRSLSPLGQAVTCTAWLNADPSTSRCNPSGHTTSSTACGCGGLLLPSSCCRQVVAGPAGEPVYQVRTAVALNAFAFAIICTIMPRGQPTPPCHRLRHTKKTYQYEKSTNKRTPLHVETNRHATSASQEPDALTWLNRSPKTRVRRALGHETPARGMLKWKPSDRWVSLAGHATRSTACVDGEDRVASVGYTDDVGVHQD